MIIYMLLTYFGGGLVGNRIALNYYLEILKVKYSLSNPVTETGTKRIWWIINFIYFDVMDAS